MSVVTAMPVCGTPRVARWASQMPGRGIAAIPERCELHVVERKLVSQTSRQPMIRAFIFSWYSIPSPLFDSP